MAVGLSASRKFNFYLCGCYEYKLWLVHFIAKIFTLTLSVLTLVGIEGQVLGKLDIHSARMVSFHFCLFFMSNFHILLLFSLVLVVIVPLLPHRSAQAEGEDDGQQLGGCHHHHHPYHHVYVHIHHAAELVVAPSGHV